MIATLRRVFRPIGKRRRTEADTLLHELRNETQAAEAERFLLARERERQRTGHFLADHLRGVPPDDWEEER